VETQTGTPQDLWDQPCASRVPRMANPRGNARLRSRHGRFPGRPVASCRDESTARPKPARGAHQSNTLQPAKATSEGKPQERHRARGTVDAALALMQAESLLFKQGQGLVTQRPQRVRVVSEDEEVVAVPDVLTPAESIHDRVVEAIKEHIGQELAGEVADGDSPAPVGHGKQVITGEPLLHGLLGIAPVDHVVHHAEQPLIGDDSAHLGLEERMVDAWEELHHIALEHEPPTSHQCRRAKERSMAPLSLPACVRVCHEATLKVRLEQRHQGMVDNPIAEGCGADQARLGLTDREGSIATRLPGTRLKFGRQPKAPRLEIQQEGACLTSQSLATRRRTRRPDQMGWIAEGPEELAVDADAFRHAPTCVPRSTCSFAAYTAEFSGIRRSSCATRTRCRAT